MNTENAVPASSDFGTLTEQTTQLPPLAILRIGDKADFRLDEVSVSLDEDNKPRTYYRGTLLDELICQTKGKEDKDYREETFSAGESVSIPGSGGLDYSMRRIALKQAGSPLNSKEVSWTVVQGDRFVIEREADDKMAKGKHKGKAVKVFKVSHAPKNKSSKK